MPALHSPSEAVQNGSSGKQEGTAAGGPWHVLVQNRQQRAGRLQTWIDLRDVAWAFGRQLALN